MEKKKKEEKNLLCFASHQNHKMSPIQSVFHKENIRKPEPRIHLELWQTAAGLELNINAGLAHKNIPV